MPPLPAVASCQQCGVTFDPLAVYTRFLTDFTARTRLTYRGRIPGWVRLFCSESCRYADARTRARVQNDRSAERRAEDRQRRRTDR